MLENHVLHTILKAVWDPVTGRSRLRINRDFRNLTGQPLITSVIGSKRLHWAGHVVRAPEDRGIYTPLYGRGMEGCLPDAVGRHLNSGSIQPETFTEATLLESAT